MSKLRIPADVVAIRQLAEHMAWRGQDGDSASRAVATLLVSTVQKHGTDLTLEDAREALAHLRSRAKYALDILEPSKNSVTEECPSFPVAELDEDENGIKRAFHLAICPECQQRQLASGIS